ncbi:MAG: hypothetical protein ACON4W_09045 [Parvibaculales bacterium]
MTRFLTILTLLFMTPVVAFGDKTLICDAEERLAKFETGEIISTNLKSHTVRFLGNKASVKVRGAKKASEWQEIQNIDNVKMYSASDLQHIMVVPQIGPLTITIHYLSGSVGYQKNLTCSDLN